MEDRPLDIPDDDGTVLDTGRYTSRKTPVYYVFFIIDCNLNFRAEVLDIIVIVAKKAEHLVEVMGMRLTKLYFLLGAGQYPLGLGVELCARDGIGIDLNNRLDDVGVVFNAVRRIFGIGFRRIYNVFSVSTRMHFNYLFLKIK
jgi:hypothetical protein